MFAPHNVRCLSDEKYCILRPIHKVSDPLMKKPRKRHKKRTFSIIKAVKQNARDRVGTPPPEKILPDPKQKALRDPKHKQTFGDLLSKSTDE
jgi:hypothetical protein